MPCGESTSIKEIPELEEDKGAKNEASPPALPRREGAGREQQTYQRRSSHSKIAEEDGKHESACE